MSQEEQRQKFENAKNKGTIIIAVLENGDIIAKKESEDNAPEVNKAINEMLMAFDNHLKMKDLIGNLDKAVTPIKKGETIQ